MAAILLRSVCLVSALACASGACSPAPFESAAIDQPPSAQPAPSGGSAPPRVGERVGEEKSRTGVATFIADRLHGRKTASGEPYDRTKLVAAHPTYPLGSVVRVTNQANGRTVEVKVVDRTGRRSRGRQTIDLSRAAAERLDFVQQGTAKVTMEVIAGPSQ